MRFFFFLPMRSSTQMEMGRCSDCSQLLVTRSATDEALQCRNAEGSTKQDKCAGTGFCLCGLQQETHTFSNTYAAHHHPLSSSPWIRVKPFYWEPVNTCFSWVNMIFFCTYLIVQTASWQKEWEITKRKREEGGRNSLNRGWWAF